MIFKWTNERFKARVAHPPHFESEPAIVVDPYLDNLGERWGSESHARITDVLRNRQSSTQFSKGVEISLRLVEFEIAHRKRGSRRDMWNSAIESIEFVKDAYSNQLPNVAKRPRLNS